MAVRTLEELMVKLKEKFGEDTADDTIELLEDISDTYSDMTKTSEEDWRSKYEENDREWRRKYTERFYGEPVKDKEDIKEVVEETKIERYEDLFKEEQ